ncbi:2Fe-2S iron-sulfur cluster-binding protein [Pigmentibacter sp. JX0631]|uniref:2Fe-2S iron-sulfur cluster-binding protein n=1 Tax=Pigmentibacter sp. JX0631 TaxID=2976982 RepID=UPI00246891A6|nr:2Fe-2S iron-sulfur cluster-binding protein [Pigmentibacter sp. JX0631]WGL59370.1 2Fe-2S iron-sulfur cluster-binding protein [Pigmentibacter sp. JX0631]
MSKPIIYFVLEDMEVEAPQGTSFQEIVDSCGADVTFGCRTGTCGTCRIKIEKGIENISAMEREEKDFLESISANKDERLGCQIKIKGNCSINYIGL